VDTILESLSPDQLVLDIGSGHGSFQYSKYNSRILAIDVAFDATPRLVSPDRILYARGDSQALPLASGTIDFAVCNHSLEHVARIRETLAELARVLKPDGFLWISVPNGFGFDDALYRLLYDGGGHVNRFSFEGLKSAVESNGLRLVQHSTLTSSFIYCNRPDDAAWPYLPRRSKVMHTIGVFRPISVMLNAVTRLLDRSCHTQLSQYGWGFLLRKGPTAVQFTLPSYFNVCASCGSGHSIHTLRTGVYRRWVFQFYRCPRCDKSNLLFIPPAGFD